MSEHLDDDEYVCVCVCVCVLCTLHSVPVCLCVCVCMYMYCLSHHFIEILLLLIRYTCMYYNAMVYFMCVI